jgi:hypothetical protein
VVDEVAVGGDLAASEGGLVGEAQQFRPGDEIGGREDAFEPGVVLGDAFARQTAQSSGFGLADRVLDPGVAAVAELEAGDGGGQRLVLLGGRADESDVAK